MITSLYVFSTGCSGFGNGSLQVNYTCTDPNSTMSSIVVPAGQTAAQIVAAVVADAVAQVNQSCGSSLIAADVVAMGF